mmetsp:Transcript_25133/g.40812  ORF Transcript_25133/g.40812 Transcript_25133/m.40812 type:complete len:313 (+) Transcript_25133:117-1055(+)
MLNKSWQASMSTDPGPWFTPPRSCAETRSFFLQAVATDGGCLMYAADELCADEKVVLAAVTQDGHALRYASPQLRADPHFALECVKCSSEAMLYIASELRQDPHFTLQAALNGCSTDLVNPRLRIWLERRDELLNLMRETIDKQDLLGIREVIKEAEDHGLPAQDLQEPRMAVKKLAIDRAELAEDPRFADNAGRCAHKELLEEAIVQWTSSTTALEVEAACRAASVPCGPIFSIKDIMEDEHFKSRQCFEEVQLSGRSIKVPSIGPKLSWSPGRTLSGGPGIGQHSDEILREKLGLSDEQLTALRSQGVVA